MSILRSWMTRLAFLVLAGLSFGVVIAESGRPNVIVIITDDQGYSDFSCHGNPYLKTPNLDALHGDCIRLSDYHVDPKCAPTRAALMTGRYSARTGVWSTLNGCYIPSHDEVTMAHVFGEAGYATAMFGKWHLGDTYPYAAEDRGFQYVVRHGGGVVGEVPDYWGNHYFNDTYLKNGEWKPVEGYCTDVWFREAMAYMKTKKDEPFFCYIATNAPHGPMNVEDRYSKPYFDLGIPDKRARFYGLIANLDENMGKLAQFLEEEGLAENTILIYMGDNGTAAGATLGKGGVSMEVSPSNGYNAGLRGMKSWVYEGGHKNACFIRWPEKGLVGGRDVGGVSAHFDLLPTLAGFCRIDVDEERLDGRSLVNELISENGKISERTLVVHNMQEIIPKKYKDFTVMRGDWRLVHTLRGKGKSVELGRNLELYNLAEDPAQIKNVAKAYPDLVKELLVAYESWWSELEPAFQKISHHYVGMNRGEETLLNCHAWRTESKEKFYNQSHVRVGVNIEDAYFPVQIEESGLYRIELRRWPREANAAIDADLPAMNPPFCDPIPAGIGLDATEAELSVQGSVHTLSVKAGDLGAVFEVELKVGRTELRGNFLKSDGNKTGAYYVYVKRM